MKKLIIGCICLTALASCNVKNTDEYKRLQAERDSLAQISAASNTEMTEMMDIINDVEENFNQIKEAEKYLTIASKEKGKLTDDKKSQIKENFTMINEILKKNKEDIAKLNKRLKNSSGETSGLKATIERLNKELESRAQAITELQTALQERDAQIAELQTGIQVLSEDVDNLTVQAVTQADRIKEQEKEINTAYYMFGTTKELKEAKVITAGFLSSAKILNEGIEKSKFIKIDIRDTNNYNIPVYAKKAKVLSDHPKDSYTLEKDATKNMVVKITDYKRFWSLSKFLVIQVD